MAWTMKQKLRAYHVRRRALIRWMGGKCQHCQARRKLEFDHLTPRTWTARKVSSDYRMKLYYADWKAGRLQLLCKSCNRKKGEPDVDAGESADSDF